MRSTIIEADMKACIHKKIALALSTGGARGISFIGVIEEFVKQGFEITSISGCSMGAVIGAAYATGNLETCKETLCALGKRKLFKYADMPGRNGLLKGKSIMKLLGEHIPDVAIENLSLPFSAVATDIRFGKEVVFSSGSLHQAIRASISLPMIFSPVEYNDMLLIDGGIINPLPLDKVERTNNDLLVGAVAGAWDGSGNFNIGTDKINSMTVLMRSSTLMVQSLIKNAVEKHSPDIMINIPGSKYSVMDFGKAGELIEMGRKSARESIDHFLNHTRIHN